jgi:hypothetical protein
MESAERVSATDATWHRLHTRQLRHVMHHLKGVESAAWVKKETDLKEADHEVSQQLTDR